MTIEELKEEAKRQGYKLIKKQENIRLLPCTCGRKRLLLYIGYYGVGEYYECPKCGKQGKTGENTRQAKINWNVGVEVK